jgi:integrase
LRLYPTPEEENPQQALAPRGRREPLKVTTFVPNTNIRTFIPEYLAFARSKQLSENYLRELDRYGVDVAELLGDVPIRDLDAAHVLALRQQLGDIEGHPIAFNRCKSFVSQLCDFAEIKRLRSPGSNPTLAVPGFHENEISEHIPWDRREDFVEAVHECTRDGLITVSAGALFLLMFWCGLRWSDARLLLWKEVVIKRSYLQLHILARGAERAESKGGERWLPVCQEGADVLLSLPRFSPWVAPNPRTLAPYVSLRKSLPKIYERAGITPLSGYHPLRHTTGTAAGEAGLSLAQIAAILGQSDPNSASRYVHLTGVPAAAAASAMSAAMLGGGRRGEAQQRVDGEGGVGRNRSGHKWQNAVADPQHQGGQDLRQVPVRRRGLRDAVEARPPNAGSRDRESARDAAGCEHAAPDVAQRSGGHGPHGGRLT